MQTWHVIIANMARYVCQLNTPSLQGKAFASTNASHAPIRRRLFRGGNGVFHNFAGGGDIYAFQCYLVANSAPDEWPESIVLHTDGSIEDLIDGIGDIKGQTATDDMIYNVAGQRLRKMQKGLLGNKKVLVK